MKMRVLAITNLYPSDNSPGSGVFIEQQIQALRSRGLEVEVMFVDRRREGPWIYYRIGPQAYWWCFEAGIPVVQTLHNFRFGCANARHNRDGKSCELCISARLGRF